MPAPDERPLSADAWRGQPPDEAGAITEPSRHYLHCGGEHILSLTLTKAKGASKVPARVPGKPQELSLSPLARLILLSAPLAISCSPAAAVPVTMNGNVVPSCTLVVSTSGTLGVSADSGRQLGSEEAGGNAATLSVVATAGAPTLTVGAPTMSQRPAAYNGTPTISVRYSSPGGANQAYTTGSSSYTSSDPLGDTLTIHMKAVESSGFPAGSYQLQTEVTCQQ
jgi:hypothetical protein